MDFRVHKSKSSNVGFLLASLLLLIFFLYKYFADNSSPSGKAYYLPGFIIFGFSSLYFIYAVFDKRPIYILTDADIYSKDHAKHFKWNEFSSYRCVERYQKYLNRKYIELYNQGGKVLMVLEITHTDATLSSVEKRISRKLKRKPSYAQKQLLTKIAA